MPAFARSAMASERAAGAAVDPVSLLDPALRPIVTAWAAKFGNGSITADGLAKIRAGGDGQKPTLAASPPLTERMIPGKKGDPDVRVLVAAAPPDGRKRPAILDMHGGGYILGNAWGEALRAQSMAGEFDSVVVSVDYRLAPETPFPGALDDNYAALHWIYANADTLGVDRDRIAVFGESAGGGHAAALAIAARDRGEIPLCCQILIYPMLDDRTGSSVMPPSFMGSYVWNAGDNRFGWSSYLGVPAGSASVPDGAVPARETDLTGLPPTFIGVGALDLFVDEDVDYARRLVNSAIPATLLVVPGAIHGFDHIIPQSRIAKEFTEAWKSVLASCLAAKV
ncbi:MAG: alpha/beta hydrolase [Alphaproteobacteria bacterium]|nr:alpha/beta hydrolase [Alphaproteobacteria bacterium]MDE2495881.1 alpha/beta hydrolase [Alphaproteobacteria bacterium]